MCLCAPCSCVLRRPGHPRARQEGGPRLHLPLVRLLLLPGPAGAGGIRTEVLPVGRDVERDPAQLHR